MKIMLKELRKSEDTQIFEMIREIGPGENGFVNSLKVDNEDAFNTKLIRNYEYSQGLNLLPCHVPQTLYWLYINERPVGYGKLRHFLNDSLLEHGGHIGYVIRPSERNKGYGKILLRELIKEAIYKKIDQVLLTCDERNYPSRKIIEYNYGQLEEIKDGTCKYWIKTLRTI
ncbi:GNAT family N-acetyltransferase [Paenibacillus wynnii]|uniref:GCN5 family acetyltransferase n=1 Tax=Paenibacillus wynnii TaxID=268407 RepID=A0A098M4U7_9BACL|nr:GNAT family N-acetyltransferase [Paenibacillus wynnii]KGE17076.1 GCN5 family acetyltransferase [Paenibacillus wynnii]